MRTPLCHPERKHRARGLCPTCYQLALLHGTHVDHPRSTWPQDDLVEEAELLRARCPDRPMTWVEIARELGVTYAALDRARWRVRRKQVAA
jgi:hypothetical protein